MTSDTDYVDGLLAQGGHIVIPNGIYQLDYVRPRSGSVVDFQGSRFIRGYQGHALLEMANVEDVQLIGHGAVFDGRQGASNSSHTVRIVGSRNIQSKGVNVEGAKGSKDGVYIGFSDRECYSVHWSNSWIKDAGRNGGSIIAGIRCGFENVEVSGTINSPGAGIDLEANNHQQLNLENYVRGCFLHHNAGSGIHVSFADRTDIIGNICEYNKRGIAATSGGNTRKVGVRRKHIDSTGVAGFITATGQIEVGNLRHLTPGTVVLFTPKNGAVLPTPLSQNLVTITDNENGFIRVNSFDKFSSEATGTLDPDPDVSDIEISIYGQQGQSYGTSIVDNTARHNKLDGIYAATYGGGVILDNTAHDNLNRQLYVVACPDVKEMRNG